MSDARRHLSRSLESRLARRERGNLRQGRPAHWASDALDCYMEGMTFADIATIMEVCISCARNAVMTEALYRYMRQRGCEHVEDLNGELLPIQ